MFVSRSGKFCDGDRKLQPALLNLSRLRCVSAFWPNFCRWVIFFVMIFVMMSGKTAAQTQVKEGRLCC